MRIDLELISDNPDAPESGIPYYGCVDGFDIAEGLSGWVVNPEDPEEPVLLELLVDGVAIPGATISHTPRDDLAVHFPAHVENAGFRLSFGGWDRFKTLSRIRAQADFAIRITGTNFILPRAAAVPSLAKIVASTPAPEKNRLDLFSRLSQLSQLAAPHLVEPGEDARRGLIEAICLDDIDSRLCWILGWTTEPHLYNEPAVVLDGQKLPAALAVATYKRADVPAGGMGFAGVLLSDWRPHAGSELAVCFGPGGQSLLRGVAGLKRVTKVEFAAHIKTAAGATPSEHWRELTALLHGPQSWLPAASLPAGSLPAAGGSDPQVAVDKLLVLPGFGCFATGWVISRLQEVQGFALKIGKTVIAMEASSLYFRPRPDLKSRFPGSPALLNRAGFGCFFPAGPGLDLAGEVSLKLLLEQGASVVAVAPEHLFRLGRSLPFDALLQLYPAIETESFFPALAEFIRDDFRKSLDMSVFKITPSPATMIFALPEDRADCLLALDAITHHAHTHIPAGCGVTIIAGANQPHGEIIRLLDGLPGSSLVFMQSPEAAFRLLPELLLLLNAGQFIFVPPRHYLSETGWNAASAAIAPGNEQLTFLGVFDPETLEVLNTSGACFAWSAAEFSRWSAHMPVRLDALPKQRDFPAEPAPKVAPRAAFISKSTRVSRLDSLLETAINA